MEDRGSATFNYKKKKNAQHHPFGSGNAHYKFVKVDIGEFGSCNDSRVFRQCPMGQKMMSGTLQLPRHPRKMPFVLLVRDISPYGEDHETLSKPNPDTPGTLFQLQAVEGSTHP